MYAANRFSCGVRVELGFEAMKQIYHKMFVYNIVVLAG
jgi:hypothetical protein